MKAYLVANIHIHNDAIYAEYRKQLPALVERHGGRFVVRGGDVSQKEGDHPFKRVVVIEFPEMAAAEAFYNSPEYAPLIRLRQSASTGDLALVQGAA